MGDPTLHIMIYTVIGILAILIIVAALWEKFNDEL